MDEFLSISEVPQRTGLSALAKQWGIRFGHTSPASPNRMHAWNASTARCATNGCRRTIGLTLMRSDCMPPHGCGCITMKPQTWP